LTSPVICKWMLGSDAKHIGGRGVRIRDIRE
jgi:hypothetical protein